MTKVYLLLSFLVQNCFVFGDIMQLPNFLTCAAANFVFKDIGVMGMFFGASNGQCTGERRLPSGHFT